MAEIVYLDSPLESEALFERLCPPVRQWFKDKFPDFTRPQKLAIPAIMDKQHLLLCSPTGSGKTLTAFLTVIDQLVRLALEKKLEKKVHAIYISPIKALANDIQRNLIGPLNEITEKYLPTAPKKFGSVFEQVIPRNPTDRKCCAIRLIFSSRHPRVWPSPSRRLDSNPS